MNEFSVLMHLLTRQGDSNRERTEIGALEEELCEALGYTGRDAVLQLHNVLEQFARALVPFGLNLRQNPFNHYWFVSGSQEINQAFEANPFKDRPRLAATLCAILIIALKNRGVATLHQVQELRGKKDIREDIAALETAFFIQVSENTIRLHPNLGYYLDLEQWIEMMNRSAEILGNPSKNSAPSP